MAVEFLSAVLRRDEAWSEQSTRLPWSDRARSRPSQPLRVGAQLDAVDRCESLAGRVDGLTGAIRGNSDVGEERVQGPHEEVIRTPPADLGLEVGSDAGADHGDGTQRVVALVLLVLATDVDLGKVALPYTVILDRVGTRRTGDLERIGREVQQHEPRKQAALGVE